MWAKKSKENNITFLKKISGAEVCTLSKYGIRSIFSVLPAWFRFAQCLRRYRDTKLAFPHLVNAGKYSTTFFVVLFSGLYSSTIGMYKYKCMYVLWNTSNHFWWESNFHAFCDSINIQESKEAWSFSSSYRKSTL